MFAEFEIVERRKLHKEVVRMLPIDKGPPECRFALLKQLWIAAKADGSWFQAEHGAQRKLPRTEIALGHGHEPVGREKLIGAVGPGLLQFIKKCFAVEHKPPTACRPHEHGGGRRVWLHTCANARVAQQRLDQGVKSHFILIRPSHAWHGTVLSCRHLRLHFLMSMIVIGALRRFQ